LKDNEGRYLFGGPQAFTSNIMWGPVVPTRAQTQGTFTVGGFDMASQVWDRMDATIEVSREDRDNFVKNMLTILCAKSVWRWRIIARLRLSKVLLRQNLLVVNGGGRNRP
jgi:HK97 family phage major capsid protein